MCDESHTNSKDCKWDWIVINHVANASEDTLNRFHDVEVSHPQWMAILMGALQTPYVLTSVLERGGPKATNLTKRQRQNNHEETNETTRKRRRKEPREEEAEDRDGPHAQGEQQKRRKRSTTANQKTPERQDKDQERTEEKETQEKKQTQSICIHRISRDKRRRYVSVV